MRLIFKIVVVMWSGPHFVDAEIFFALSRMLSAKRRAFTSQKCVLTNPNLFLISVNIRTSSRPVARRADQKLFYPKQFLTPKVNAS